MKSYVYHKLRHQAYDSLINYSDYSQMGDHHSNAKRLLMMAVMSLTESVHICEGDDKKIPSVCSGGRLRIRDSFYTDVEFLTKCGRAETRKKKGREELCNHGNR